MRVELFWIDECPAYQPVGEILAQVLREEKIDAAIEMIQVRDNKKAVAK